MRSGRGVRVAVIDSGVHDGHPHVGGIAEGFQITQDGTRTPDFVDRIGHGTAVTAAIKEKAPAVEIVAIKVFDRSLSTTSEALAAAIDAAIERGAGLINLSLGTTNASQRERLAHAVKRATQANVAILAAAPTAENEWLPGALLDVIAVSLDWSCPRDRYRVVSPGVFAASGYPRPIPGVPPERNLKGLSFAVANMTGLAARAMEGRSRLGPEALTQILVKGAAGVDTQIPQ